ncbi:MAG TPA: SusC/RagA family TonB-linked outer membrane protein [Porphyromonadaceae bacterium]|nr:SusC/RagA family TonB-linked outer membrane protein [Porphyromonadaceae bacterium]HCM21805.1 SusC/RagA family TonB-linked outer membrane protein [Porphyromonadaceae bacterium]
MKCIYQRSIGGFYPLTKIIVLVSMLLLFTTMSAKAFGQEEMEALKLTNVKVIDAIKAIEKATHYKFVYNNNDVNVNRIISVNAQNKNIETIIKEIFADYDVSFREHTVLVKTSEPINKMVQQQSRIVKGLLIDANTNDPIIGASVWIKNSTQGVITDVDGVFTITVSGISTVLAISYLGYESIEIEVGDKTDLGVIKISSSEESLEEVVVVGYGTQRKESVIGAISSINVDQLKVPTSKISNILAGRLAGVVSVTRSGEPGAGSEFYIRGISTFGENKNPLVLVDGIERSLDLVDPEDIESFSILKDATATAVYGVRGANGVIIITTRKGQEGKPRINFRIERGLTGPTSMPKMVNSAEFAEMYNEASNSNYYTPDVIEKYRTHSDPDLYPNVNWIKSLYNDYAHNTRLNMNVSGGGSIARYYIAGSLYDEGSIFQTEQNNTYNSALNYSKVNFRANIDINVTPTTVLNANLANVYEKRLRPGHAMDDIWSYAFSTSPNAFPARYSDGRFSGPQQGSGFNPYNLLMYSGYANDYWNSAQALVGVTQDFGSLITPGLKANIKFSWDAYNSGTITRGIEVQQWLATGRDENGELEYNETHPGQEALGYERILNGRRTYYLEGSITYDKLFAGKHRVGGLLLYNQKQLNQLNADTGLGSLPYRNQGIAGRLTYSFKDTYFAEVNMGYNGSENFAPGHRFGFFPAGAVGYLVSNEDFWHPISHVVDIFKLKSSYGLVGNDQIGGNRRFIYEETIISEDNNYAFGSTGQESNRRLRLEYPPNPYVSWETAYKFNVGAEISLFKSLKIEGDYFHENREGIFMQRGGLAGLVGLTTMPYVNIGKMKNQGFDGTLSFNREVGTVSLTGLANFTYTKNTMIDNDEPNWNYTYRNRIGKPYQQPFGLVALGLFESQEEIDNSPTQSFGVVRVGDIKYLDVNGDGVVDPSDEIAIGYPDVPQINYGFGMTAQWRGFDCSVFFQGIGRTSLFVGGGSIYGFSSGSLSRASINKDVYIHRWTEDNPDPSAKYPRLDTQSNQNNNRQSTYRMHDASFLRLKNAEVGYTLPRNLIEKFYVSDLRVYLSGVNLLTFSPFKLWDPERGGGEGAAYPPNKMFTMGLNIYF